MAQTFYQPKDRAIEGLIHDEFDREREALKAAFEKVSQSLSAVKAISADYTAAYDDYALVVDTSAATVTVTLPDPASVGSGKRYLFKKVAVANDLVITRPSGVTWTIEGAASLTLAGSGGKKFAVELMSDGTAYHAVADYALA